MNPTLIELKQNKPGFRRFIGSWLITGRENIVVDVGPSNSTDQLIHSLTELGVDRIDRVLLTHIHIDHAGGLAPFLEHFPMARVICHEKAIPHLVDPSKLWAGTRKTLGPDLTDTYGPIRPVKRDWLVPHTEAKLRRAGNRGNTRPCGPSSLFHPEGLSLCRRGWRGPLHGGGCRIPQTGNPSCILYEPVSGERRSTPVSRDDAHLLWPFPAGWKFSPYA